MGRPAESTHVLEVLGRTIRYGVRRSAKARRARVCVGAEGVQVVLPPRAGIGAAGDLLREHAAWVASTLDRLERRRAESRAELAVPAGCLLLRGEAVVVSVADATRGNIGLIDGVLTIRGSGDAATALERWLREEARRDLAARVAVHAAGVSRRPGRIVVRDQRTRWGSCSSRGTLSFSYRLVMAPPAVLDYVAAHEVAHLDVPNHSPAFWRKLGDLYGDVDPPRRWLRRHGHALGGELSAVLGPGLEMNQQNLSDSLTQ